MYQTIRYNPWEALAKAVYAVDQPLSNSWTRANQCRYPEVDVWESDGRFTVTAELPGVDPDAITVDVDGHELIICGHAPQEDRVNGERERRSERSCGRFSRAVTLPFRADPSQTTAELRDGVLSVHVYQEKTDTFTEAKVTAA